ncbi:fructokinase [Paracoccus halophilus]|uniref:Fructokinase n=1 Tax=Paracoccus halophilus TaxID=376733 RepID=A0A099EWQ9_9RHOB|nr:AAA family ATPase [Paracoccus halophilus]KGJ02387.1 nucleoside triphosphate hydrolase [Paracoccus halophilus]SFA61119.1 fructokinase [Paracoccus halophilus]
MKEIIERIDGLGPGRRVIAILGAPGSGKSTLAARVVAALDGAALVPMDGFHLDDRLLSADGLLQRKGAPETFDAAGFLSLIGRLKAGGEVVHPVFDRSREQAIAGAARVRADTRLVVVEGNYLLLDRAPWRDLAGLWDLSVMLDVPMAELRRRLTARWRGFGKSPGEVEAHLRNDLANAETVLRESLGADMRVTNI